MASLAWLCPVKSVREAAAAAAAPSSKGGPDGDPDHAASELFMLSRLPLAVSDPLVWRALLVSFEHVFAAVDEGVEVRPVPSSGRGAARWALPPPPPTAPLSPDKSTPPSRLAF